MIQKNNMDEAQSQKVQVDFLLADFNAIKSEISRRSDQQKTAYLLYLAAISWIFTKVISGSTDLVYIIVIWLVVVITKIFIVREAMEIGKLGEIIREEICVALKNLTKLDGKSFIPSENRVLKTDTTWTKRHNLNKYFDYLIFIGIPLLISVYILYSYANN